MGTSPSSQHQAPGFEALEAKKKKKDIEYAFIKIELYLTL